MTAIILKEIEETITTSFDNEFGTLELSATFTAPNWLVKRLKATGNELGDTLGWRVSTAEGDTIEFSDSICIERITIVDNPEDVYNPFFVEYDPSQDEAIVQEAQSRLMWKFNVESVLDEAQIKRLKWVY